MSPPNTSCSARQPRCNPRCLGSSRARDPAGLAPAVLTNSITSFRGLERDTALSIWSASTGMPFLTNLPALENSPAFALPAATEILRDISTITALEATDENWATAMTHMPAARCVADLTDAFNAHLWPARSQASTRSKHQSNWAVVVTWAIAWNIVHLILPMHTDILKALTWELLCLGIPRSVISAIWAAVQHRHKTAHLHPSTNLRLRRILRVDPLPQGGPSPCFSPCIA